jgi:hypothetical protein
MNKDRPGIKNYEVRASRVKRANVDKTGFPIIKQKFMADISINLKNTEAAS